MQTWQECFISILESQPPGNANEAEVLQSHSLYPPPRDAKEAGMLRIQSR
jgi:hypothetical protein